MIVTPGILASLQRSVHSLLIKRVVHPDFMSHGIPVTCLVDSFPLVKPVYSACVQWIKLGLLQVYIPPIESSPMSVIGSDTDSFLIPRWGGVNVYNYVSNEEQNISFPLNIDVDMRKVMGVWIGQIRTLLGAEDVK